LAKNDRCGVAELQERAENGAPYGRTGPKAVDGDSEAAGYLKAADPSEINFVGVVVSVAKVSGIDGNFARASRS